MCFILLQHITTKDAEAAEKIMVVTRDQIERKRGMNRDALYLHDDRGDVRTDNWEEAKESLATAKGNLIISHLRLGTSGEKTALNAHGWEHMGWKMVHNGFCQRSGAGWSGLCDSALFFYKLVDQIHELKNQAKLVEKLIDIADDYGFNGRAILWNEEKNVAYTFGDFNMYVNDEVFALSSAPLTLPEVTGRVSYRSATIPFREEDFYGAKQVKSTKMDGVWRISNFMNPDTFGFEHVGELEPYVWRAPAPTIVLNPWKRMSKKERKEQSRQKAAGSCGLPQSRSYDKNVEDMAGAGHVDKYGNWVRHARPQLPVGRKIGFHALDDDEPEVTAITDDDLDELTRVQLIRSLHLVYDQTEHKLRLQAEDDEILKHITPKLIPKHILNIMEHKYHVTLDKLEGMRFECFKGTGIFVPAYIALKNAEVDHVR